MESVSFGLEAQMHRLRKELDDQKRRAEYYKNLWTRERSKKMSSKLNNLRTSEREKEISKGVETRANGFKHQRMRSTLYEENFKKFLNAMETRREVRRGSQTYKYKRIDAPTKEDLLAAQRELNLKFEKMRLKHGGKINAKDFNLESSESKTNSRPSSGSSRASNLSASFMDFAASKPEPKRSPTRMSANFVHSSRNPGFRTFQANRFSARLRQPEKINYSDYKSSTLYYAKQAGDSEEKEPEQLRSKFNFDSSSRKNSPTFPRRTREPETKTSPLKSKALEKKDFEEEKESRKSPAKRATSKSENPEPDDSERVQSELPKQLETLKCENENTQTGQYSFSKKSLDKMRPQEGASFFVNKVQRVRNSKKKPRLFKGKTEQKPKQPKTKKPQKSSHKKKLKSKSLKSKTKELSEEEKSKIKLKIEKEIDSCFENKSLRLLLNKIFNYPYRESGYLTPDVSWAKLRKSYHRAVQMIHPDKHIASNFETRCRNEKLFLVLQNAYERHKKKIEKRKI